MTTNDLPEELESCPNKLDQGLMLSRVFDGSELVAVHHELGLVAVWYGGTGVNVYDPAFWSEGDTGEVYHFNLMGPDVSESQVRVKLASYGFHFEGQR